jgi:ribose transport system permease protein
MTAQASQAPPQEPEAVDEPAVGEPSVWARVATTNFLWIFLILIGLVVTFTAINSHFLEPFNIKSIFADQSTLIVLAIGMTFVIVTAGIDLSVGYVLICSGVVAGETMLKLGSAPGAVIGAENAGWNVIAVGIAAGIVTGLGFGLLNGILVAKARIPPLIVTLGVGGMALGIAQLLTNGTDIRGVPNDLTSSLGFGSAFGQVSYLIIIAVGLAIVLGLVLAYTRFGRYTYAVGSNEEAARRVGINCNWHLIKVYGLMGAMAGIAGVMNLAHFTTTTIGGHTTDNLGAIAACVIGGTSLFGGRGNVWGTLLGALIVGVFRNGLALAGLDVLYQTLAVGVLVIVAVSIDQWIRKVRK